MKPACIALCLSLALSGCLGTGTEPGKPPGGGKKTTWIDTTAKVPADTIHGFALDSLSPKAAYMVDNGFMDWKCTTTVSHGPRERRGDTTFVKAAQARHCLAPAGGFLKREDTVQEFGVLGTRILSRDSSGRWVENLPFRAGQQLRPYDPWHPFETMPSDSLLRVRFLGDSAWAFVRRYTVGPAGLPARVDYLYVKGHGPVFVNNRYKTTAHGYGSGEIIRLIRYKDCPADSIRREIDRILARVPGVSP